LTPADETTLAIRGVRSRLRRLRRAARVVLSTRVVSWLSVWGMGLVTLAVLADLVFRFPAALRGLLLLGLAGLAAVWVRRRLVPVAQFKPSLADVAMRVERWMDAKGLPQPGPLATGIELPLEEADPFARHLSRLAARSAAAGLTRTPWGLLRWGPAAWALAAAVGASVALSAGFNAQPTIAVTGLTRLFAPWLDTPWPKRTQIADATTAEPHPADRGLALRAALLTTNREAGETPITVTYRVIGEDGRAGPESQAVLVPQPIAGGASAAAREMYERLIEPAAWQAVEGERRWLEYSFRSDDDATVSRRVEIVEPPRLVERASEVALPGYAQGLETGFASGVRRAGPPPSGEPVEIGPVLVGSRVELDFVYSKAVVPAADAEGGARPELAAQGNSLRGGFVAASSVSFEVEAVDAFGLRTREPLRLRVEVIPDGPPEATVLEPAADEAVLATATVPLMGEGRDDIAVASLTLQRRLARAAGDSLGAEASPDPGAPPIEIARAVGLPGARGEVGATLELSGLGVSPGDEVWVEAVAVDNFDLDGQTHAPVISSPRRLRVIAPAEFVELIQTELEGVRRTAMRLDRQQAELQQQSGAAAESVPEERAGALERVAQRQAALSQRLASQSAMLERLADRAERNRLDDEIVRDLLEQAGSTTDRAAEASDRAAQSLVQQPDGAENAEREQQRVRDELARLIDQLDRGQDGWVVRRNIERLLDAQQELRDQTAAAGEQTVGRPVEELSPDERSDLERIAQRQRELADQANEAVDALRERAEEIRGRDPTQAAAMDEAAENAARERLAEQLRDAAEQIGENQTGSAGRLQDQSIEAMQEMLERLENAQRNRDAALRRQLSSVIQSIESLIRQEDAAIRALGGDPAEAARPAERVHANTLAAEAETRAGLPELIPVADLLVRAAASQGDAIAPLRADPPDTAASAGPAAEAMARLREALAEAQRQDENAEQREQDRKKRELRDAYKAALAEQVSLQEESAGFIGAEVNRRVRAELRALGQRQEALRATIESIPEANEAGEIGVITLLHERIDLSLADAVRSLGRGTADLGVTSKQEAAIELLRSIVETLTPKPRDQQDEFRNAQGGGGGGGGAGGDQPLFGNLEQLRLLRALQAAALTQTRDAGESAAGDVAELQRRIADQARVLVEQMQRPPAPGPAPEGGQGGQQP
jgi:hypothetical protein